MVLLRALAGLLLAVLLVGVAFLLGMRAKSRLLLDAVRRMNRAFMNPRQMATAGTPGAYAAIIRHRGRTSGASYETPVGAVATDDGFVIALPYGTRPDWLKNVLAAGSATIVHEGHAHRVTDLGVVPMESVESLFPAKDRRTHRMFRVDLCLRARRAENEDPTE